MYSMKKSALVSSTFYAQIVEAYRDKKDKKSRQPAVSASGYSKEFTFPVSISL